MLNAINFRNGQITFDNLLWLTEQDFKEQKNFFGQDLLQVRYFEKYILDVGWYNISNTKGIFIVQVIKDMNWDKPLFIKRVSTLKELRRIIEICIKLIYRKNEN